MQRIHQRESGPSCLMPYGCDWDALVLPITTRSLPVLADWASTCIAAFGMQFLNYQFDRRIWYAVRRPSLTAPRLDGSSWAISSTLAFGWQFVAHQLHRRVWVAVRCPHQIHGRVSEAVRAAISFAVAFGTPNRFPNERWQRSSANRTWFSAIQILVVNREPEPRYAFRVVFCLQTGLRVS